MKFLASTLILSTVASLVLADHLPELDHTAPTAANVKQRISPPENAFVYDVLYGKGFRMYVCNPEKEGFQHWYNVQTNAVLYPTKDLVAPFDIPGREIAQLNAAPLNPEQQMASPIDTIPVITYYKDGSWAGTTRPLATTTKEEGRAERGDSIHMDDHVAPIVKTSTDGYLSHAKYIVRLNTVDGVVPSANECVEKGQLIKKPFTAYYMLYTDNEGKQRLEADRAEWNRMVQEYTPERIAIAKTEKEQAKKMTEAAAFPEAEVNFQQANAEKVKLMEEQQQKIVEQQQKIVEQQQLMNMEAARAAEQQQKDAINRQENQIQAQLQAAELVD